MKRRVIALLLVLALGLSMVPFAAAAEYEGLHQDRILPAMRDLMLLVEGNYTSVTRNDSNALSIGFIQWHGGQALNLLKAIVDRDPESAQKILGDDLLSQIVNGNYDAWYYRTLTAEEGKRVSELLGTKAGMEVQDEFAYEYFLKFIDAGWKMGMRTDATTARCTTNTAPAASSSTWTTSAPLWAWARTPPSIRWRRCTRR